MTDAEKKQRKAAYQREWRARNAEKVRKYNREYLKVWRERNRDAYNEYVRGWRAANPDKVREYNARYRSKVEADCAKETTAQEGSK
ncbi:MAG: hypothetical protein DHS20C16_03360 [Phycisphaerae bacterium]|nr:MAG: hypothetical protein DHS20C16_03360 [Phycisphaerae bacterium]